MSNKTSDKNVVTEEDLEVLNEVLLHNRETEQVRIAIEHILAEREQKDKRIKELEEQVKTLDEAYTGTIKESKKWFDIAHNSIPTQVVIDKIEEIKKVKDSKYYDKFLCERDIENVIEILQELLETK